MDQYQDNTTVNKDVNDLGDVIETVITTVAKTYKTKPDIIQDLLSKKEANNESKQSSADNIVAANNQIAAINAEDADIDQELSDLGYVAPTE